MTNKQTVLDYIKAKKEWTKCKQLHCKQLCKYCGAYIGCEIYEKYVDTWLELQKHFKE